MASRRSHGIDLFVIGGGIAARLFVLPQIEYPLRLAERSLDLAGRDDEHVRLDRAVSV